MTFARRWMWLGALVPLAGMACNEDPKELSLCDQVAIKNKLCEVDMLKDLPSQPRTCAEATDEERCVLQCGLGASCDYLQGDDDYGGFIGSIVGAIVESIAGDDPDVHVRECVARCKGFHCGDGETVEPTLRCDGFADCTDGTDEADCAAPVSMFTCNDGRSSILWSDRCNGIDDCFDGSDESGCLRVDGRSGSGGTSGSGSGGATDGGMTTDGMVELVLAATGAPDGAMDRRQWRANHGTSYVHWSERDHRRRKQHVLARL